MSLLERKDTKEGHDEERVEMHEGMDCECGWEDEDQG